MQTPPRRPYGQRRASPGVVTLLLIALAGLTAAPLVATATATATAVPVSSGPFTSQTDPRGADGTAEPKTGPVSASTTTFSDDELGFSVSWEESVWAAQRDHAPTDGAIAGVLLIHTDGGLLYVDAIPAGELANAAACSERNQTLIEGFPTVADVEPLEDAAGRAVGAGTGDPAYRVSTLEIDGEPAYLYVGCAAVDEGTAFLAFTYYLTQGDGLDAEAFIESWLPDVQAVVDSLERA